MTFEDFWRLYPRKKDKLDALKAWKQMTRDHSPVDIIEGLKRNLPSIRAKETQYQRYPAGWLRKGGWMDEPEAPAKPRNYADTLRGMLNGSEDMGSSRHDAERLSLGDGRSGDSAARH